MTQHSRDTPQFYLTAPSPCPYLAGKEERKVFTHLVGDARRRAQRPADPWRFPPQPVDRLSAGLRGAAAPASRCASWRHDFRPTRSMRRIAERNADVIGEMRAPAPTSEQYSVFRAYLDARHRDGGMADMTVLDYAMMVEDSHVETRLVEYRRRGPDSASPAAARAHCWRSRSPTCSATACRWSIRSSIRTRRPLARHLHDPRPYRARASRMGLPYVYLGYWVPARARWTTRAASCRRSG